MKALLFRTRIAVLWVGVSIAATASLLLYLFVPGALEEMLAGEMEGETLTNAWGFFFAAVGIIPVVMAAVTLLVNDRVNRWVNLIAGLTFGLFGVFGVGGHVIDGDFNGHTLLFAVAAALAFLIAGLGWAGLRQSAPAASERESKPSRPREKITV